MEAERLGGSQVDDELDLRGLLDWQVGWVFALEDLSDIETSEAKGVSIAKAGSKSWTPRASMTVICRPSTPAAARVSRTMSWADTPDRGSTR